MEKPERSMKSGLLVLVDLFSLLTLAMFSIFVITSDFKASSNFPEDSMRVIEISVSQSSGAQKDQKPLAISQLAQLGFRLVDLSGKTVLAESRQIKIDAVSVPDGAILTIQGDVSELALRIDVKKIRSPMAFSSKYDVKIEEVFPRVGRNVSFGDIAIGSWVIDAFPFG